MRPPLPMMLAFVVLGSLAGCSPFRLQEFVRLRQGDWTMYGGNAGRTNVSPQAIVPPLTVRWEYDAGAGFSAHSASVAESLIFVGNLRGEVHAIRLRTGEAAGVYDFGSAVVGTPVIGKQMLYVALTRDENSLVAYDLEAGVVKWEAKLGDVESSPLLLGERLFVAALDGKVFCVDAASGAVLWSYALPSSRRSSAIRSSPAAAGELLVVGCDNGGLYALALSDGKLCWSATTGASIPGSPAIADGRVFVGSLDRSFYAFELTTGKLLWSRPLDSKIFASPAVDGDHLFVGTSAGSLFALRPGTGEVLWQTSLKSVIGAAPLISGNVVYVAGLDRTLSAFSAETGGRVWQYTARGRIKTMPVIARGFLILMTEDRSVLGLSEGGAQ